MSQRYDFRTVEPKWQQRWSEERLFEAPAKPDRARKSYLFEMFAYPSGDIHMGHFRNYSMGDAYCRWLLMNGHDVLHPFGWDAFGLPAENAAIKHDIHPREWTLSNIETSRGTLQELGTSFDWNREVTTCLPDYYKFSQWMFLKLRERGLVYRKGAPVNWCGVCNTVLANEQVKDGRCWRDDSEVEKRDLEQWYIKITDYAQRLHDGLDTLDRWPAGTVASQRNWIGRSEGAEITFQVDWDVADRPSGSQCAAPDELRVFTTRPDTLWGVTFMTVAPESPFGRLAAEHGPNAEAVAAYNKLAAQKTEIERTSTSADQEKTGIRTGWFVTHPTTGARVPVMVGDYALATYGTGYVMGVPAHDERDFRFAKKHELGIAVVIQNDAADLSVETMDDAYTAPGTMVESGPFDGRRSDEAIPDVIAWLEERGQGKGRVQFRLRDWLISRQRYWGCPIPMIHCDACGEVPVPTADLPVRLPEQIENWLPKGRSPLADVEDFVNTTCPTCGGAASRDADTMDTFMCSAWYHLRYLDPHNEELPFSKEAAADWLPADLYIGGREHANGHLIYFRFITKVMKDAGYLDVEEPVVRLFHQGVVADEGGAKMSKSVGNVVSPVTVTRAFGVDASRIAMFFLAPSADEIHWSDRSVAGASKLVGKLHALTTACAGWMADMPADARGGDGASGGASNGARAVRRAAHEYLRRINDAMADDLAFNTPVAALYEFLNVFPAPDAAAAAPEADRACYAEALWIIAKGVTPLAPHLGEEMHAVLGGEGSVLRASWPVFDESALASDTVEIAVQIKGKVRSRIKVPSDADEDTLRDAALADPRIAELVGDRPLRRVIVVPGRLVNLIV